MLEGLCMNQLDLNNPSERVFGKILKKQAEAAGERVFLISDSCRLTFAEVESLTNRIARSLKSLGVGRKDRVALYMGNRVEMVLCALAANKLGAIWVPVNTDYKGEWLFSTINRSLCRILVTDSQHAERLIGHESQLNVDSMIMVTDAGKVEHASFIDFSSLLEVSDQALDDVGQDYGDTCAVLWTSGTTGRSKGVMQSYNSWIRPIVDGLSPQFQSGPDDIIYCMLPLYNSGAWTTSIFRALIEGIACVIEKRFSVKKFWDRINHFGATQTFLIGAMCNFLLNEEQDHSANSLKKVCIVSCPADVLHEFRSKFDTGLVKAGFGMSEIMLIMHQSEDDDDLPPHALGYPPSDIEVALMDEEEKAVEPGEAGELWIRPLADHVLFNGYFLDESATENAFRCEWFLSGDILRQDVETGAYYYVDRKKDALRYAGRNISSMEVEEAFRKHPAVADVAAYGVDGGGGIGEQELKVDVVLKKGASVSCEELCRFINGSAPYYFVPRYMDFVDSLPYTPTNKLQKYVLRSRGVTETTWDRNSSDYALVR